MGKLTKVKNKIQTDIIEPAQLAAVAIDPNTLNVVEWGGVFDSLMCPEPGWEERVDQGALFVNKLKLEDIAAAPPRKEVWLAFAQWCKQFKVKGKGAFGGPLPAGKNIRNFDIPIADYLSERYGTVTAGGSQNVFHPRRLFDLEDLLWHWFEGPDGDMENLEMGTVRAYFGLQDDERSHSALFDVRQTAEMICRFLRIHRKMFRKIPFKNSMRDYRVPLEVKR